MATTTTNFGWDIPQSTDLVKDGATAIAALGQDIDTAFVDLKGGTTGQVLKKTSATDLDVEWGTPSSGLTLINTTSFSGVSSQAINDVFSATYDTYLITCTLTGSTTNAYLGLRLRVAGVDASGSDYVWGFIATNTAGTSFTLASGASATTANIARPSTTDNTFSINMANPFLAKKTIWSGTGSWNDGSTVAPAIAQGGAHTLTTSYTGFSLIAASGTITGSVSIYGYNK